MSHGLRSGSSEQVSRIRTITDSLVQEGFVSPDYLDRIQYGDTRAETMRWLKDRLRNLKPGVTEIYIHPAIDSPELRAISSEWRDRRVQDYRIFSSPEIHKYMDSLGIERTDWGELQELQAERPG